MDDADAATDDVQLNDNINDSWTRAGEDDDGDFCTAAPLQCSGYGTTVRCTSKIDMSKYNSAVIGDAYSYPADKGQIRNYASQQEYSDLYATDVKAVYARTV